MVLPREPQGNEPRVVLQRAPTSSVAPSASDGGSGLPDDLLSDQVRRLQLFAVVAIGSWTFGILVEWAFAVVAPLGAGFPLWKSRVIEVSALMVSAVMWLYVRYGRATDERKIDAGLVYLVANAFLVAMLNSWVQDPRTGTSVQPSWNTVLILVYAMIVPAAQPRRMLVAALVAASMDPLGVWLAHLRGATTPSVAQTFIVFLPNYVYGLVAIVPALYMRRLGRQLRTARAMGSYHLVEKLGEGGMGEVWRASHRFLARHAAVKLIRHAPGDEAAPGASDGHARRRFEREAQVIARLRSPHTVDIFDFGVADDGTFYYVMELLEGMNADVLVRRTGPVPPERAVHILRQICHSLSEAESLHVVHRDIKPANIFLCRYGEDHDFVKVLDFGIVKAAYESGTEPALTGTAVLHGTPAFMAPEQAMGTADIDGRADIYAVGCVAYWLLTGEHVFAGATPMALVLHHVRTPPVPPSQRTEQPIPAELDAIVMSCLAKVPSDRPQTAKELSRRLASVATDAAWTEDRVRAWLALHAPSARGDEGRTSC